MLQDLVWLCGFVVRSSPVVRSGTSRSCLVIVFLNVDLVSLSDLINLHLVLSLDLVQLDLISLRSRCGVLSI